MSKIINEIQAQKTNEYRAVVNGKLGYLLDVTSSVTEIECGYAYVYDIGVKLGQRTIIRQGENSIKARNMVMRSIQEYIFGEFREDLFLIEKYLWEEDFNKATEALTELRKRMFSI